MSTSNNNFSNMAAHNFSKQQIWVFGDIRTSRLLKLSCNVLVKTRKLATDLGYDLIFLLFEGKTNSTDPNESLRQNVPVEKALELAVIHGADYIFYFENRHFNPPQAHIIAFSLAAVIESFQPALCLFALTDFGRELAARTAAIGKLGVMADCTEIIFENGRLVGLCPAWGETVIAKITFRDDCRTGLATVQPYGKLPELTKGRPGKCYHRCVELPYLATGLRLVARDMEPACERQLEDAEKVIVGGMGLSFSQGFEKMKTLAKVLGAEVATTRPPVLKGWMPEDRMLGQTGKSVHPKLLISVGTSGSTQYIAGIIESGFIVAINRDPAAPIFQIADIGIVADAASFLPLLTERAKQAAIRALGKHRAGDSERLEMICL